MTSRFSWAKISTSYLSASSLRATFSMAFLQFVHSTLTQQGMRKVDLFTQPLLSLGVGSQRPVDRCLLDTI